jgi:LysM repeat protein
MISSVAFSVADSAIKGFVCHFPILFWRNNTMGMFDFIKDVGAMIGIGGSAEPDAGAIKAAVDDLGLEAEGLDIVVDGDTVKVSGKAASQEIKEKIILATGNVRGIGKVEETIEVASDEPAATFYTVQKGDTLSVIAKAHYGSASKYPQIFTANKPMLTDPDKIYPGQVLRIPAE